MKWRVRGKVLGSIMSCEKEVVCYVIIFIFVLVFLRFIEWLKIWIYFFFLKEFIVYFFLVILFSSVILSLVVKKFDKMFGEKVSGNDIKISRLLI